LEFQSYFRGSIVTPFKSVNAWASWPTSGRTATPRGSPCAALARHVAPPIEKNRARALPSCPLHSPPSCLLALALSPAALGPRSASLPWLPRQSHAPSTLAARRLQPSEHPAPCTSSASSRRSPASEALESLAAVAMPVRHRILPLPSGCWLQLAKARSRRGPGWPLPDPGRPFLAANGDLTGRSSSLRPASRERRRGG
jgi:hypothetical protein